jgi:hypothetical protein
MRAPRCPQVYKSSSEWETWIQAYMKYTPFHVFPTHYQTFDAYKNSNPYLKNRGDAILLNNWKYLTYEWLTGRKHHILSFK